MKYLIALSSLLFCFQTTEAQSIDHWETAVYNYDLWRYRIGDSAPPADWMQPAFDASNWAFGNGGFGYGDNDDGTIIDNTLSVYLRRNFQLFDTTVIVIATLHADYDDAFVAYLNGVEIARNNINGDPPAHDEPASSLHEAQLYNGEVPEAYSLTGQALKNLIVEGTNTLAVQVHNEDINSSDLSSNFFLSLAISDNSFSYGDTPDWFSPVILESHLPLLVITTTQGSEIPDEPKVPAHMGIIDNGPGQINTPFDEPTDYDGIIAIEIRGASSQMFPKKNYGFETQLEDGSNNNVSLLGLPVENDWVLHGPYPDKTLLRNRIAYHMGSSTGKYTPRTRLCEVLVNGDYRGVYILTERIKQDDNRVDIAELNPDDIDGDEITGGYLIQIDRDNPNTNEDGWWSDYSPNKFYAYHDPGYDDLVPVQKQYIREYLDNFEDDMFSSNYESEYLNYIDVDSWVDYVLITEIAKHIDAYKLSFYMHKKKVTNGGKLHFGPLWDFNLGFGNFDFACPPNPQGWSYDFQTICSEAQPFWVLKLLDIPNVQHQMNCRWTELREGPLHTDTLIQYIDNQVALIGPASERNFDRWPIIGEYVWPNNFVGDSYEAEVLYLKNWLNTRLSWMDNNIVGDCDLYSSTHGLEQVNLQAHVFPNPAGSHLFVELAEVHPKGVRLELFDLLGRQLAVYELGSLLNQLDVSGLGTGMYVYRIVGDVGTLDTGSLLLGR